MGNYAGDAGAVNLELHTDNRARVYLQPQTTLAERLGAERLRDESLVSKALGVLREEQTTALFVYLHQVDTTGHTVGFDPDLTEYRRAIENVDTEIGRLIETLNARPNFVQEDWLIAICTDHGGLGTRHGSGHKDPEILNVFLIFSGSSVPKGKISRPVYLVDLVPTVLTHLGIRLDPSWSLDGHPIF